MTQALLAWLTAALQQSFWMRWLLANTLGWSLALYAGAITADLLGGLPVLALLLGGFITGIIAGGAQMIALRVFGDISARWYAMSALGGVLGAVAVFPALFVLIIGRGPGFALMGGLFGLCFGGVQALALDAPPAEIIIWWGLANLLAGCACGWLALGVTPFGLPVLCSGGPLIFGAITGLAWREILRAEIDG